MHAHTASDEYTCMPKQMQPSQSLDVSPQQMVGSGKQQHSSATHHQRGQKQRPFDDDAGAPADSCCRASIPLLPKGDDVATCSCCA